MGRLPAVVAAAGGGEEGNTRGGAGDSVGGDGATGGGTTGGAVGMRGWPLAVPASTSEMAPIDPSPHRNVTPMA